MARGDLCLSLWLCLVATNILLLFTKLCIFTFIVIDFEITINEPSKISCCVRIKLFVLCHFKIEHSFIFVLSKKYGKNGKNGKIHPQKYTSSDFSIRLPIFVSQFSSIPDFWFFSFENRKSIPIFCITELWFMMTFMVLSTRHTHLTHTPISDLFFTGL